MNARLQQLMDRSFTDHQGERFDPERFAELIVQECIGLVEPTSHHEAWAQSYLGGVDGLELLHSKAALIKQHFGIES
jgi:hypothetical protein